MKIEIPEYSINSTDFLEFYFASSTTYQKKRGLEWFKLYKEVKEKGKSEKVYRKIAKELGLEVNNVRVIAHRLTTKKNNEN